MKNTNNRQLSIGAIRDKQKRTNKNRPGSIIGNNQNSILNDLTPFSNCANGSVFGSSQIVRQNERTPFSNISNVNNNFVPVHSQLSFGDSIGRKRSITSNLNNKENYVQLGDSSHGRQSIVEQARSKRKLRIYITRGKKAICPVPDIMNTVSREPMLDRDVTNKENYVQQQKPSNSNQSTLSATQPARLNRRLRMNMIAQKRQATSLTNNGSVQRSIDESVISATTPLCSAFNDETHTRCRASQNDINAKEQARSMRMLRMDIIKKKRRRIANTDTPTTSPAINVEYHDQGDAVYECQYCGALLWADERINKNKALDENKSPIFTLCCMKGKIELPLLREPPQLLQDLLSGKHPKSKHFLDNIIAYNMMFCFTSLGAKFSPMSNGRGPYCYTMHGQNYHRIGSLLPVSGSTPKFSQLYIYDTQNEDSNRIQAISTRVKKVDDSLVAELREMIDQHNPHAKAFRMARDRMQHDDSTEMRLQLISKRNCDGRRYNLPTTSEVAALIVGDIGTNVSFRDIILHSKSGQLQRIHELHPSYLALQYPLLFPYGEDGYRPDIALSDITSNSSRKRERVTIKEFCQFRIHERARVSSICSGSIKYLFKCINKGSDRVTLSISSSAIRGENGDDVDEIKNYQNCRYLSACGAAWRIFGFEIHYRWPSVQRLSFHLPNEHSVCFDDDDPIDVVLNKPNTERSMFLQWMECNKTEENAKNLTYAEFPRKFVWVKSGKFWKLREKGTSIGRIYPVEPGCGERYYLRILLNHMKCPTSYEQLRTVEGVVYPTFKEACYALGLLDDDRDYIDGITESSF